MHDSGPARGGSQLWFAEQGLVPRKSKGGSLDLSCQELLACSLCRRGRRERECHPVSHTPGAHPRIYAPARALLSARQAPLSLPDEQPPPPGGRAIVECRACAPPWRHLQRGVTVPARRGAGTTSAGGGEAMGGGRSPRRTIAAKVGKKAAYSAVARFSSLDA